jgi:glycosyltransferase involved in cell wall biosynthesis
MIIAVDARTVFRENLRGTAKTLVDLYQQLALIRPTWSVILFHRGPKNQNPFSGLPNVEERCIEMRGDRWDLWQQVRLPLAARKARASVLHCPANFAPRWPLVPLVVTIHDLIPLETAFWDRDSPAWERCVSHAARIARKIITPSHFTKKRIVDTFRVPAGKVVVSHWAPDGRCVKIDDSERIAQAKRRYGLSPARPYFFGFAASDPRKNTRRILAAWSLLPENLRRECSLLLVGIQEPFLTAFRQESAAMRLDASVLLHGFADEADIGPLLSGSLGLCYPSLSEGFGLPILDAFFCDTPVLTSDRTSLPEVAGSAALLVNPEDAGSIAHGLERLLTEHGLRLELIARGRERARAFSWNACAESVCQVFEEVVRSSASVS